MILDRGMLDSPLCGRLPPSLPPNLPVYPPCALSWGAGRLQATLKSPAKIASKIAFHSRQRPRPGRPKKPRKGSITVIDLYTWTTPNGRKISILLEELGLPYTVHPIDIGKDEQFKPDFLKISPNNRIPAIVDRDNSFHLMESGAIMLYLAEKTHSPLLPQPVEQRYRVVEWLMWQMGGPGPMFGQVHHFTKYNPGKAPYAEERYLKEAHRLYGVLDRRLGEAEFVGDTYSVADIAIWPWVSRYEWQTVDLKQYPNVLRWYRALAVRPAFQKGYHVPRKVQEIPLP
jgi:GST-like protein